MGEKAVLIEAESLEHVAALRALLRSAGPKLPGIIDVIAAAQTVLVSFTDPISRRALARFLLASSFPEQSVTAGRLVVLHARYDGDDLVSLATELGMSVAALINWHCEQTWNAVFAGFSPGFMYLSSQNPLTIPRLRSPRTSVPAGSVALGGEFSAIYPTASPGGWRLIARSNETMWDANRREPSLLRENDSVQFKAVRDLITVNSRPQPLSKADDAAAFEVKNPGLLTTMQDLGRPAKAALGVTGSGALDRAALRRANRLVGNAANAACLETVHGGLRLWILTDVVVAISGGQPTIHVHSPDDSLHQLSLDAPTLLCKGQELELVAGSNLRTAFRSYVSVRGGFAGPRLLGSRSRDTLAAMGPTPLRRAEQLCLASDIIGAVSDPEAAPAPLPDEAVAFRYVLGPRNDWFTAETPQLLASTEWHVSSESNRIGLRLAGIALKRRADAPRELPSEGTVKGAIQVPTSGMPVLFLADHPTTGGYPVIGVVVEADLDKAAQLAPGATLRFVQVSAETS